MAIYRNVEIQLEKLTATPAEHNLVCIADFDTYPIILTVRQNQTPDAQMELYATADGSISAQDSVLQLIFKVDALEIRTDSRFVISEALMNKIKGMAKKIHYTYLQCYFADRRGKERIDLYGDPDAQGGYDNEVMVDPAEDVDQFEGFYDGEEPVEASENE